MDVQINQSKVWKSTKDEIRQVDLHHHVFKALNLGQCGFHIVRCERHWWALIWCGGLEHQVGGQFGHAPGESLFSFLAWYQWCIAAPRKKEKSTARRTNRNKVTDISNMIAAQGVLNLFITTKFEKFDVHSEWDTTSASLTPLPTLVRYKISQSDTKFCVQTTDYPRLNLDYTWLGRFVYKSSRNYRIKIHQLCQQCLRLKWKCRSQRTMGVDSLHSDSKKPAIANPYWWWHRCRSSTVTATNGGDICLLYWWEYDSGENFHR